MRSRDPNNDLCDRCALLRAQHSGTDQDSFRAVDLLDPAAVPVGPESIRGYVITAAGYDLESDPATTLGCSATSCPNAMTHVITLPSVEDVRDRLLGEQHRRLPDLAPSIFEGLWLDVWEMPGQAMTIADLTEDPAVQLLGDLPTLLRAQPDWQDLLDSSPQDLDLDLAASAFVQRLRDELPEIEAIKLPPTTPSELPNYLIFASSLEMYRPVRLGDLHDIAE